MTETLQCELTRIFGTDFLYESLTDDTFVVIVPMMYHFALYVNPDITGIDFTYDDRFCYPELTLVRMAIASYKETGRWRFYKKHHNLGLTVAADYLYREGALQVPENAIERVDWNIDILVAHLTQ